MFSYGLAVFPLCFGLMCIIFAWRFPKSRRGALIAAFGFFLMAGMQISAISKREADEVRAYSTPDRLSPKSLRPTKAGEHIP